MQVNNKQTKKFKQKKKTVKTQSHYSTPGCTENKRKEKNFTGHSPQQYNLYSTMLEEKQ